MKFTDEQLSMVLSAHESGQLIRNGLEDWNLSGLWPQFKGAGCLLQIAHNTPNNNGFEILQIEGDLIWWFDHNYDPNWPADFFLYELEQQGVA